MSDIYTIIKGDDTYFNGKDILPSIKIITTLDLTGWRAKFTYQKTVLNFEDISNYIIQPRFTSAQTRTFLVGTHPAELVLFDNEGKRKTVFDNLFITVTDEVGGNYVN